MKASKGYFHLNKGEEGKITAYMVHTCDAAVIGSSIQVFANYAKEGSQKVK
jgi:hypothetical protein